MSTPTAAVLRLLAPACILVFQGEAPRSTRSGVYTAEQARRGQEIYALSCTSCHTAASHTGATFVTRWEGKPLWEIFDYISTSMPKSEPGSLSSREYTRVLAYLLKMNGMPAGAAELKADSTVLKTIRIEFRERDSTQHR